MRFLVDANLPRALSQWLSASGDTAEHVLDIGLGMAKDWDIWQRAAATGAAIVSKDEDFADRVYRSSDGPAVVWLRTGNGTFRQLTAHLEPVWPSVRQRLAAGDRLIEVR